MVRHVLWYLGLWVAGVALEEYGFHGHPSELDMRLDCHTICTSTRTCASLREDTSLSSCAIPFVCVLMVACSRLHPW